MAGVHQAAPVPGQHEEQVAKPAHFSLDFILVHLTPPQLCQGICWSFVTHLQTHQGCLTCWHQESHHTVCGQMGKQPSRNKALGRLRTPLSITQSSVGENFTHSMQHCRCRVPLPALSRKGSRAQTLELKERARPHS